MELRLKDKQAFLTKKETDLLEILLTKSPLLVKREVLLEQLWDNYEYVNENTLNVNINRVRKKLQDLGIENE